MTTKMVTITTKIDMYNNNDNHKIDTKTEKYTIGVDPQTNE